MPSKKSKRKQGRALSESDGNPGIWRAEGTGYEAEVQGHSETSVTQNISGTNIQIGDKNVIKDERNISSDTEYTTKGACASSSTSEAHHKTYAEALTGEIKCINQQINAGNVTININTRTDTPNTEKESLSGATSKFQREQAASFLEAVDMFDRGDFILVTGKQTELEYTDSLTLVKWTAVLDFDPESRTKGLLSSVESTLNKRRILHIGSIQDTFTFSEQITNWIFMMGCVDRPDTITANEANIWEKAIEEEIDNTILLLKQFETGVTNFTFVVLWPSDSNTAKCAKFVISKVCTRMSSSVVIIDTGKEKSQSSLLNLDILKEENDVNVVELGFKELYRAITNVRRDVIESSGYFLPTRNKTYDPRISEEKAQWLKEDFEILYTDNKTGIKDLTLDQMKNEMYNFYKGGTLPWFWWYILGPGNVEIQREIMHEILRSIKECIKNRISETITLLHLPGSGGTTLSQSILWALKDTVPCAQIKHNSDSAETDLVEKITFLSDITNMPVIILLDGEDEYRINSLKKLSERMKICVIMFWVRRFIGDFQNKGRITTFKLGDKLSKREAKLLRLKLNNIENEKRRKIW